MLKSYVDKKVNVLKDAVKDLDKKMKQMKMRITSPSLNQSLMEGPLSNQNSPPKQTERSSPQVRVSIDNET
jgi:hypothetical protein